MRTYLRAGIAAIAILMFAGIPAAAGALQMRPILVSQPYYGGMQFYVHQARNLPDGWYATYDGYPVTQAPDGLWVYGAYSGPYLVPTNLVVGSVIPSLAGLSPYPAQSPVYHPAATAYVFPPPSPIVAVTVSAKRTREISYLPYVAGWQLNPQFMTLGSWTNEVDRIGILRGLGIPVAWRGRSPTTLYVWNGTVWQRIEPGRRERPLTALKKNSRYLNSLIDKNVLLYYRAHVSFLIQQAARWNYYWMGEMKLGR